jgi:cell division ATPase FtsA
MGFLFGSTKKEKLIAIFDIGSGSVGGAMVRIPMDNKNIPVILKSVRTNIKSSENSNFDDFIKDTIKALSSTANSLHNKKVGAPDEIICVLSSPLYISETRVVKMSASKPFVFSKKLANDLINKEVASLAEVYKNKYNTQDSSLEMIEQHTMSISLNGYTLNAPLGMKCKSLEMNMIISLSSSSCTNKIRESLSAIYHHTPVSFSSFTVATYLAVRDKYISPDSYLLIDISGEITDVGIVTRGALQSVLSFPFGRKTFFRYIYTKLDIELRDAEELFKLYSDNHLSPEFRKKVEPLFRSIQNSWVEAFKKCVSTLPRNLVLPSTIFLTTDSDIKKWFVDVLQNEDYIQSLVSEHKCSVKTLEGQEFLNMCDVEDGGCDPFLMIEAIAIMRKMVK